MALGPVAYWRLSEPSGVTAEDETGDHDGTYVNTPALDQDGLIVSDPDDKAVLFAAGSQEYVTVPDHADLDLDGGQTIACWVNNVSENFPMFINKRGGGGSTPGWSLRKENSAAGHVLGYLTSDGGPQTQIKGTTNLTSGGPYFLCATMSPSGSGKIYVNGVQEGSTTPGLGVAANAVALHMGRRGDGSNYMSGVLDDPVVFDYDLSPEQILNLYNVATTTEEASTEIKCGDCTLTFYYDPGTKELLRAEVSGLPADHDMAFKVVEEGDETWEYTFTEDGSEDCPYTMLYTDDGEGGLGNITMQIQAKRPA